jgi:Cof subfamily protein (haloacid dehalogenase superfamily)
LSSRRLTTATALGGRSELVTTGPITRELFRPDLVASDLDGTLLTAELEFAPELPAAIVTLQAAGVRFAICTGRMFRSTRRVAAQLGLTQGLVVCYQGAMVADLATGERLLHRPLDADVAVAVVVRVRELGRHLNVYIDDQLYVEQLDAWARRYAEYAEVGIEVVDDLAAEVAARPPTKFVVLSEPADVDALLPRLQDEWHERLAVVRSQASYIELAAPGVSKSGALQWLCDREGLRRERTVTCGDAPNDLDMLRWAGLGVAVSEAAAEVRAAAGLVVDRADLPDLFTRLAAAPPG